VTISDPAPKTIKLKPGSKDLAVCAPDRTTVSLQPRRRASQENDGEGGIQQKLLTLTDFLFFFFLRKDTGKALRE